MKEYLIVTFHTTSEAMATERACRAISLSGKLIPVPRSLSAGCGIAWRCLPEVRDRLNEVLESEDIEWEEMAVLSLP